MKKSMSKKYNLHEIMTLAWEVWHNTVRLLGRANAHFGDSLRRAWELTKMHIAETVRITIKAWFMRKSFTTSERIAIAECDGCKVERETEKAMLLKWNTDYGTLSNWVPKSCIEQ